VTLLDAYALVALIADEPAAEEVEAILREGEARVVVVNLAEAVDVAQRAHGFAQSDVRGVLEPLLLANTLASAVSGEAEAWLAAELRGRHYSRKDRALSLADCLLLAHAVTDEAAIATADPPLATAARSEGVAVLALPDSSGKRP
jgi:PIN domain nuclease of toxin-antitoxin system